MVALVLSCGGLAHVPLDMLFLYSLPDALCALQVFLLVASQQSGGECDVRAGSPLVCHLSVPAVLLCHCGALHHAATGAVGESDTGDVPLCADFRSHLLTAGHQFHQRAQQLAHSWKNRVLPDGGAGHRPVYHLGVASVL